MHFRLVHLSGSLAGRVRELTGEVVVLGRDPAAAQVLFGPEDRLVSRRHVALSVRGDAVLLRDLDSSTGTFVKGEDVEQAELHDGDVFELGSGGPRVRVERSDGGTLAVPPGPATPRSSAPDRLPGSARVGPGSRLRLTFLSGSRKGASLELAGAVIRIGRAAGSTVWAPEDRRVSAQHAKIVRLGDGCVLLDLESTNGTFLNGHRIERAALHDGDVIGLSPDGPEIAVQVLAEPERGGQATVVIPDFARLAAADKGGSLVGEAPLGLRPVVVGRGEGADLRLDSPIVSRRHARFTRGASGLWVEDLGSANGTFVGGARVQEAPLSPGDRVVVGPFQLEVGADVLRVLDVRSRARLEARGLTVVAGGRTLLHDISLTLRPGSFTALIGPSGSGKSTLLSALSGVRQAQGGVLLNGIDLYRSFDALKATLGYVPQDDIVHAELTVGESLGYTARLRLPADTTAAEREARVASVLSTLELTERRDVRIDRLSGGQRKRVSIASELLTEPNVLFLDEPTSGLDPALEEALMLLLRELAYKGKTVVIVTHTLENIHLCDAVALLVDGHLAFHGPPEEARSHFDIGPLVNLYARLKEKPAAEWAATRPPSDLPPSPATTQPRSPGRPARPRANGLRQLAVLTARYATTLRRDVRNLGLLLAQAPLVAGLVGLSLLYGASDVAYTKPKNTLLFLLALTSVWFGCSNAVREIVKERAIYVRERMANLGVLPYVWSKVLVLGALASVQCAVFLGILHAWFGIPGRLSLLLASILLASLVGILLGLTVSALVGTPDRAMSLLPIVLIPQVLFTSPAIQMDMKGPAGLVARAMPTWWGFDLLRRIALAPDEALPDEDVVARLEAGHPVLMTRRRFESMLQDGYRMFSYRGAIETTWTASFPEGLASRLRLAARSPAAAADALVLAFLAGGLLTATLLFQKRLDRH